MKIVVDRRIERLYEEYLSLIEDLRELGNMKF